VNIQLLTAYCLLLTVPGQVPVPGFGGFAGDDAELCFGAVEGGAGEAGGLALGFDLADGDGAAGEEFFEKGGGALLLGKAGRRWLGRGAEVEAVVTNRDANGIGEGGQVVFANGEKQAAGFGRVGALQLPDDAGYLGDDGGATQAFGGGLARLVLGSELAQVMGQEDGFVGSAGQQGKADEHAGRVAGAGAVRQKAAEAVNHDQAHVKANGIIPKSRHVLLVVWTESLPGVAEGIDNPGRVKPPGEGAIAVHLVGVFALYPDNAAGRGGEFGAVGPGEAGRVAGGDVKRQGRFADT